MSDCKQCATLRAEVDNLKRMVIAQEKLMRSKDAENSALSAWQCVYTDGKTGLVGDEYGNQYCAMAKMVEALRAEIEKLRADIAYADKHAAKMESLLWGTAKEREKLREALEIARTYIFVATFELSVHPTQATVDLTIVDAVLSTSQPEPQKEGE